MANVFMAIEPLAGKRLVELSEQRTKQDWAQFIARVSEAYPEAERITLVMDNLNTHAPGSLYDMFPPEQATALWGRLEFEFTRKHGSWLNMAEIELNVLFRQCLDRRIDNIEFMRSEIAAWVTRRDTAGSTIDWQVAPDDARIKLKRLYPTLHD